MKRTGTMIAGMMLSIVCLTFAKNASAGEDICGEAVSTEQGPVAGMIEAGTETCVYKGIPYAAPPVRDLRWKAPQDAPERSTLFSALEFGPECAQVGNEMPLGLGSQKIERSEDCLYLNIWRPMKSGVFPVMVWIHGGALQNGAGSRSIYWGDRLVDRYDVVLVTINYRLGPFGFFYHPDLAEEDTDNSSGNYGLLDQVKALEWVSRNISAFGGDPDNVTIFGESAGGWSTCNLMASPLAKGLFQRAVIESGGCDAVMSVEQAHKKGLEFSSNLGCSGAGAVECMREKSTNQVTRTAGKPLASGGTSGEGEKPFESMWKFSFLPVVDGHAFKEVPVEALRSGRYNNVPLMVGTNRDEVKLFIIGMPVRLATRSLVNLFIREMLGKDSLEEYKELYPYRSYRRPADAGIDAFGDMALGCKCFEAAEAGAEHQPKTYYYRFDYDDNLFPHMVGAAHAIEISFIFDTNDRSPSKILYTRGQTRKAQPLSDVMMEYWVNFAKTGDPNGPGLPDWPAYTLDSRQRLYLDLPVYAAPTDNVEKCRFWREKGMGFD